MSNNNDNPVYLTYHEATIYKNDLNFLNDGAWLNDHIILFMYEYLNYNVKYQEKRTNFSHVNYYYLYIYKIF